MEIVCKNLTVGYNNVPIHSEIDLTITSGSYTCIVGDNGVGKSTLVKTLLGLLPPIDGTFKVGNSIKRQQIGYLPQQSQIQKDFPASVYEVVLSGSLKKTGLRPFYNKKEKMHAKEMMKKLGIDNLIKKSYSELSGGQQQRVLLARALLATSEVLLLDEPTAGLDMATKKDFYRLLKELNKEGITIIMITHDLHEVIEDASNIICLNNCGVNCYTKDIYKEMIK